MKAQRLLIALTSLAATSIIVACATTEAPIADQQPAEQNATEPPAKIPESAPPPKKEEPKKVCVATCTKDDECQNSCEAAPSGAQNCCEPKSKKCYINTTAVCPKPQEEEEQKPAY